MFGRQICLNRARVRIFSGNKELNSVLSIIEQEKSEIKNKARKVPIKKFCWSFFCKHT